MNEVPKITESRVRRSGRIIYTHTLALLPKGKKAGILLWGFGGEVRDEGQGGDGRCSRSNNADGNCH